MRALKVIGIILLAVVVAVAAMGVATFWSGKRETTVEQTALDPFYTAPSPLPASAPGTIIRSEPMALEQPLQNANAYRVLYMTAFPNGTPRVSGAMLFIPTTPAPVGGRNVVSWAHPTVGMGPACAPSRSSKPLAALDWLQGMLNQGWIVTATDYAGLGTEGTEYYLIGQSEAIDVINAVRMARNFPNSQASDKYGVYGHSQGGHSALWVGNVGPKYAPELKLVGVSGAAPAGDLTGLVNELWNTGLAWVIGGEVLISYPAAYPNLNPEQVATAAGLADYQSIGQKCLIAGIAQGQVEQGLGKETFIANPMSNPLWAAALREQDAKPVPASVPVLIIESINDGVVVPDTIGYVQQTWCKAGSALQVDWLGPLRGSADKPSLQTHMYEGAVGGSLATSWLSQRFQGAPAVSNCDTPPLVPPSASH